MSQHLSCVSISPFPIVLLYHTAVLPTSPLPGRCTQSLAAVSVGCPQLMAASFLKEFSPADGNHLKWLVSYTLYPGVACSQWQTSTGLKGSPLVSGWDTSMVPFMFHSYGIRLRTGFNQTPLFSYPAPLSFLTDFTWEQSPNKSLHKNPLSLCF